MTITICGYSDQLSGIPGDTIAFKVSSRSAAPFQARLVRVIHADVNPAGPGLKLDDLSAVFSGTFASVAKPLRRGSYGLVPGAPRPLATDFRVGARIFATAAGRGPQCVLSQWDATTGTGFQLLVDADGVTAVVDATELKCAAPVGGDWQDVWMRVSEGRLQVGVDDAFSMRDGVGASWASGDRCDMMLAAVPGPLPAAHFNGKIEQPSIVSDGRPFAAWDFSRGIDTLDIIDTGPHGLSGRLMNLPTRAVRSSDWDGSELCWRSAATHYAAIHFHDDDLHDAGWATDFEFTIPESLRSGAYAMELAADGERDWLPFYVSAETGKPRARIVFVAPTYTYQAYANYARGNFDESLRRRVAAWGAYPHNPDEHPEVGLSTYNVHGDGSGVAFASMWRPMLTFRPGFLTFDDPRGSGCRHYVADSHLLDWLEHEGVEFDIVTDHDLEREGCALLESYEHVLTGTHPEYHTERTLDAFAGYVKSGGHLAYLGGNGFYWRVAVSDEVPGALEIRRAGGGTRAWAALAGEEFNALDGAPAGLWRNSGRPPQQLVGIGFASQGNFEGSTFRCAEGARRKPGGWILEGVSERFGDYGLSGGGAAGFELDAVCYADGSPRAHTLLARSEGHGRAYGPALDALLTHAMTRDRQPAETLIAADMIFAETPAGGSLFSVGSITFCGSLSHAGYRNDVSTLLRNYLQHRGAR
jgi:N,N-dimethylformamidase